MRLMWLLKFCGWTLALLVLAALITIGVLHRTPLAWIGITGFFLTMIGFFALVVGIPLCTSWATQHSAKVETELYSARTAQWCVATGLTILVIVAIAISLSYTVEKWPSRLHQKDC